MQSERITTFKKYAMEQAKTAIYPQEMVVYPFLGLAGEAGEVAEIVKKCMQDCQGVWNILRLPTLKKELGDVLWYLSEIARRTELSLEEVAQWNVGGGLTTFNEYSKKQEQTVWYQHENIVKHPFFGLAEKVGRVCELAKKCIRDDGGVWSLDRKEKLAKELGDVLWYVSDIARCTGLSLEEIATANVEKLKSRQERGVLKGSGNDR